MEDLKKVLWYSAPITINENFEAVEEAINALEELTGIDPQANITTFSGVANLTAVPGTFADEAAVQTYLVTLRSEIETRLDNIESKINSIITALRAAGVLTT